MKRRRMTRTKSRRNFRKGSKTNARNTRQRPMRGGWRI